jgi:ankyrin repeat protein
MSDNLMEAIKAGDIDQVRALVNANPQSVRANEQAVTPILVSIYMGRSDISEVLRGSGVDLTLHEAAACGAVERLSAILQAQPERIDEQASDGFTPLCLAAYFGHLEIARYLLAQGADVNLQASNAQKVAPLHAATSSNHAAIIDLLLDQDADVNAKQEQDITPLMQAAHHGDVALVRKFLDHGADPTARSSEGKTALSFAEEQDFAELTALLQA